MTDKPGLLARWMRPESRSRRMLLAAAIYLAAAVVFAAVAGPHRLVEHTQFNHYALLADAWLHGRWDLRERPAELRPEQRLRLVPGQDLHQLPAPAGDAHAAAGQALGRGRQLPRRAVHGLAGGAGAGVPVPVAREAAAHRALAAHRDRGRRARAALRVRHGLLLHGGRGHRSGLLRWSSRRRPAPCSRSSRSTPRAPAWRGRWSPARTSAVPPRSAIRADGFFRTDRTRPRNCSRTARSRCIRPGACRCATESNAPARQTARRADR